MSINRNNPIIKLLYIVAGEAEAIMLDAEKNYGASSESDSMYEITEWRYNRLCKALNELEAAEEAAKAIDATE